MSIQTRKKTISEITSRTVHAVVLPVSEKKSSFFTVFFAGLFIILLTFLPVFHVYADELVEEASEPEPEVVTEPEPEPEIIEVVEEVSEDMEPSEEGDDEEGSESESSEDDNDNEGGSSSENTSSSGSVSDPNVVTPLQPVSSSRSVILESKKETTSEEIMNTPLRKAYPDNQIEVRGLEHRFDFKHMKIDDLLNAMRDEIEEDLRKDCLTFDDGSYYCVKGYAAGDDKQEESDRHDKKTKNDKDDEHNRNDDEKENDSEALRDFRVEDNSDYGGREVFVENAKGKRKQITPDETQDQFTEQDTTGPRIVWQSLDDDDYWQIFFYDQEIDEVEQITNTARNSMNPHIHNGVVVWQSWVDEGWEIFMARKHVPESDELEREDKDVDDEDKQQVEEDDKELSQDKKNKRTSSKYNDDEKENTDDEEMSELADYFNNDPHLDRNEKEDIGDKEKEESSMANYFNNDPRLSIKNPMECPIPEDDEEIEPPEEPCWEITQLTDNRWHDMFPIIAQNMISWQGYKDGNWHVFLYDMEVGVVEQVSHGPGKHERPKFILAWDSYGDDGQTQVLGYDFTQDAVVEVAQTNDEPALPSPLHNAPTEEELALLQKEDKRSDDSVEELLGGGEGGDGDGDTEESTQENVTTSSESEDSETVLTPENESENNEELANETVSESETEQGSDDETVSEEETLTETVESEPELEVDSVEENDEIVEDEVISETESIQETVVETSQEEV